MNKQTIKKHLHLAPPFARLNEQVLADLAEQVCLLNFDNEQIIIREGNTTDGCYLILSGLAQAYTCNNQAGLEYVVGNLGPYELFGEFAVIDSLPITLTVRSIETIECLFIPKQHFIEVLDSHHQLARNLLNTVVARYRSLIQCSNFG